MAQSVTLNGSSFSIPDVGENDWGQNVTDFLVAIPSAVLQKSGGSFTLTAEVDFGGSFGLKSLYYKSRAANPATAGAVRLGVADVVSWRNNANGANLDLGIDAADALTFGSNKVVTVAGGFTLVDNLAFANQKGIRLMEQTGNGTNYIEIVAPDAVTASVTLKLPDGVGTSGQVLSTDGAGVLSWINAAGGGTINSGVQGRLAIYPSNGTTLDDTVTMTNTVSVAIATHGQASVYTIPDGGQATANFVITEGAQTVNGAKTLSGVTTLSGSSTGIFIISTNNTLKVDSTNILVSIGTATMTHPLHIQKSVTGAATVFALENTESANAASHAQIQIITAGASAGDPFLTFNNGVTTISYGVDNSDSDALCWTAATTLNGTNIMRLTTSGALTVAAGLTVTTGGAIITAGGLTVTAGGVLLSADALTIAKTTNQIILGTTNTVTISSTAPAASRVYTIPDAGGAADFLLTVGAQTITGAKTFADQTLKLQETGSTDVITINVAALSASRDYTLPDAGGSASFVMTAGNQTIGGVKTMSSDFQVQSGASTPFIFNATTGAHDSLNIKISSTTLFQIRDDGLLYGVDGAASAPTYSFASDTDSGIYFVSGGGVGISADNLLIARFVNSGGTAQARFGNGSAATPSITFQNDTDTGIYTTTTNQIVFTAAGVANSLVENGALLPGAPSGSTGTVNLGNAGNYWNDVSHKTLTDRGCMPWCDDGVDVFGEDGKIERVSDLKALTRIKKHATRKTPTGLPRLDYATFPKHAYKPVEEEQPDWQVRVDERGEKWAKKPGLEHEIPVQDGVEMTMMWGVVIGAFKEVDSEIDVLKKQVTDLNQRIATLEQAA